MKDQILKLAGVKSESAFYKKFPTEAAFMKMHGKAFKKAAMGASMVNKQLHQLSDFGNMPKAQNGLGGEEGAGVTKGGGNTSGYVQAGMDVIEGVSMIKDQNKAVKEAKQNSMLTGVQAQAVGSQNQQPLKNYYARPEDTIIQPDQVFPSYGVGTNILSAQNGAEMKFYQEGLDWKPKSISQWGGDYALDADQAIQTIDNVSEVMAAPQKGTVRALTGKYQMPSKALGMQEDSWGAGAVDFFTDPSTYLGGSSLFKKGIGVASKVASKVGKGASKLSKAVDTFKKDFAQGYKAVPTREDGGNIIAQYGAEIQNTYAPNTLYDDLGYEPLNDSDQIKAFYHGGRIPMAQNGLSKTLNQGGFGDVMNNKGGNEALGNLSNQLINKGRGPSAGSKIGGGVGQAAGTYFGGPVGGAIGKFAGEALGSLVDQSGKNIEKYDTQSNNNITGMMGSYIPQQFGNVMEDGGWVSHDWQPQVIAKFGEYDMKDLLKPPADADMLRAGGHIRGGYIPPSERAMQTYAMGGELQVYRGEAEPISNNPYLPDGGETVMFRGPSHENGGMPISYGSSPVEVEGGEPAVKLRDGGSGEDNMVVFGNLKINKEGANMLGNPKLKNQKFKNYVNDLSKIEAKQNKIIDRSTDMLDNLDVNSSFDKLKMSALQANLMGSNMKLKVLAEKKQDAANLQSAINDTAKKYGYVAEDLAQGKIKQAKNGDSIITQRGKKVSAQDSVYLQGLYRKGDIKKFQEEAVKLYPEIAQQVVDKFPETNYAKKSKFAKGDIRGLVDALGGPRTDALNKLLALPDAQMTGTDKGALNTKPLPPLPKSTATSATTKVLYAPEEKEDKFNWMNVVNQALPYLRPSDAENLDPRQLMGELYALSNNQLEPVQAQTYQPQLQTPYDISLQDQLNEITAQTRQAERLAQNNPEALASIYAQSEMAKSKILGEQMRINQGQKAQTYAANIGALNNAQLQNIQMYDTQQQRQEAAKSATKATTQEALNSISSKYAQNKLENRQLATMENLYNYRYDKSGRAINMNPLVDFDEMIANATPDELDKYKTLLETKTSKSKTTTKDTKESRNGSIVKAIKNL